MPPTETETDAATNSATDSSTDGVGARVHVHDAGRPTEELKAETDAELTMYYGGVGATLLRPDGRLVAAADPRREGAVRVVRRG